MRLNQKTPPRHSFDLLTLMAAFVLCVVFSIFQSAVAQSTFTSPTSVFMSFSSDDVSAATPYPSAIAVYGLPGTVTKVTVTLNNLDLGSPPDFDILLVGPNGHSVILMSDAQGNWTGHIINMTLTFDDAALTSLPSNRTLVPGAYKPTNFDEDADFFLAPAPVGPFGATLSVFNGTNPNGVWNLFIVKDHPGHFLDEGPPDPVIVNSWRLTLTTQTINPLPNPLDDTSFFVTQHYHDFLSREPDPLGFITWVNGLNNCAAGDTSCDRVHVSAMFFQSEEFRQRGYFVYLLYPASFGRKPDYAEFIPDLASVAGFLSPAELETAKVAFINDFMARPAFVSRYSGLNNTQYVDTLLMTAGVTLTIREALIDALNAGTKTRAVVLREIVESTEVFNKYLNQAFVVMQYFGYLRRDPDALYLDWIRVLDTTGDFRLMVTGFVNSLEYRFRFGR